ncbi:MAG: hypothetical protein JXA49_03510 [Actinobacteria bacterium]|nr:hypothetical protein [Actinomycetota bacterium]
MRYAQNARPGTETAETETVTFNVADTVPGADSVSTTVESDIPVVAERAMYWNNRTGGHDSIGASFQR